MFKVKKIIKEDVSFNLETDFYIPITVEFPSNDIPAEEIYYYRILNEKSSFVEIKVNSKSHKIYCITVVSINDIIAFEKLNTNFDHLPVYKGNPIIDVDIWNTIKIVDFNNNFLISMNADKLFVLLDNAKQATQRLILPNIELLLDQDSFVVGYIFYDIPSDKIKDLEDGIAAYRH